MRTGANGGSHRQALALQHAGVPVDVTENPGLGRKFTVALNQSTDGRSKARCRAARREDPDLPWLFHGWTPVVCRRNPLRAAIESGSTGRMSSAVPITLSGP